MWHLSNLEIWHAQGSNAVPFRIIWCIAKHTNVVIQSEPEFKKLHRASRQCDVAHGHRCQADSHWDMQKQKHNCWEREIAQESVRRMFRWSSSLHLTIFKRLLALTTIQRANAIFSIEILQSFFRSFWRTRLQGQKVVARLSTEWLQNYARSALLWRITCQHWNMLSGNEGKREGGFQTHIAKTFPWMLLSIRTCWNLLDGSWWHMIWMSFLLQQYCLPAKASGDVAA